MVFIDLNVHYEFLDAASSYLFLCITLEKCQKLSDV